MTDPIVVDLSHWNPTPDWAALKAGGVVGVIHKATEGTSYVDPMLFKRAKPALDAGLRWSTYHFMRGADILDQINHYLTTIDPLPGERVCLDHEDRETSLAELEQAVTYLLSLRPDLQVTVYSGHLIKEQLGAKKSAVLADNTSLWIAQYTTAPQPSWPQATWPAWSLWQYTDRAKVSGITQPVDGNRWNGDEAALLAWFGPAGAPLPEAVPLPGPQPEATIVYVDVTVGPTPPGVEVRVRVNGALM